ncbi:MAG TPA: 30S ribosomal protein S17 [Dehalococcoidales bacterium]|nr:30S ribosomal protein S17 [Dehalococcoidales bacterium]
MEEKRKTRIGKVIGDKMNKTVIVAVNTPWRHPVYNKTVRRVIKYYVHDEKKESKTGDTVKIIETRPISKLKRWRIAEVVIKAEVAVIKPSEITT